MPSASKDVRRAFDSGLYQLVVRVPRARTIAIGSLGHFTFPAGHYVYTGSARRGLESRIARHLRTQKKKRWHIDYLLRQGRVVAVRRYRGDHSECELNGKVGNLSGSRIIARDFGSSDCGCYTHLFYFERNPAQQLG